MATPALSALLANSRNSKSSSNEKQTVSEMLLSWEQKAELGRGSGFCRKCRPNSLLQQQPTPQEQAAIASAKKYAVELSVKNALSKQASIQQRQLQMTMLKREQAVILLSRIYIGNINFDVEEETVRSHFQAFGSIKSLNVGWDATLNKRRGFAFIEYELPEAAMMAVECMDGVQVGARNVKVARPNNLPEPGPLIDELIRQSNLQAWVYVASVHHDLADSDVRSVFEAFGSVSDCVLAPDSQRPGRHRGFGFVQYDTAQAAADAVKSLNNFDLGGQLIRVCRAITEPQSLVPLAGRRRSSSAVESCAVQQQQQQEQQQQQQHRSPSLVLRNMVSADEVDSELSGEVSAECEKFGQVRRVTVEQEANDVTIFVEFVQSEAASVARDALNGRYFGGRQIVAELSDSVTAGDAGT